MKIKLVLVIFFSFCSFLTAQENQDRWQHFRFLIGDWRGEGSGRPGEGEGTFSFRQDLDNNIIIRKSHSEYPPRDNKPATVHEDLMIIYSDTAGIPCKAVYFDNEGHVINYSVQVPNEQSIIFISEKMPGMPVFRLTYLKETETSVYVKFEMSQDGEKFFTYIEGRSRKI